MADRMFDLGDILSVTTGRLVSPRHMEGVYDICRFLAGEPVWTHQLGRVCEEAAPGILARHPKLAEIVAPELAADTWLPWLNEQKAIHGAELAISPMNADQHQSIDPLSELAEKVHPSKIIAVTP